MVNRIGRPKKEVKRDCDVRIRMTYEEYQVLQKMKKSFGVSMSELTRWLILSNSATKNFKDK